MLRGKERVLPYGSFVALTVAQEHYGVVGFRIQRRSQRHARSYSKSVAERPCRSLYARERERRVPGKRRPILQILSQKITRKKAAFCQYGVERAACMSFA